MKNEERKMYVQKLMESYEKSSKEYLDMAESIYRVEFGFVNYMKEKVAVSSYEKAYADFEEEVKRVNVILNENKMKFDELLNEFSMTNNNYSSSIISAVRRNELTKEEVESAMKELAEDFDNKYAEMIKNYTETFKGIIEKIEKVVKSSRKFVIEYGDFQLTDKPTVNEYKPIYDKHDAIYDKFIFEFQAEALRINFMPEQIKNTYTRVTKLLDENYDIFSELTELLENK